MLTHRLFLLPMMVCLLSSVLLIGISCAEETEESEYADIILLNGTLYTVQYGTDWSGKPENAVAIKDRTILSVGSASSVEQYTGPDSKVYDLKGKMVLPGFIDTHIHFGAAAQLMAGVDLSSSNSAAEILDTLREYEGTNKDLSVIRGFGWRYFLFNESGPNKGMLDEVISDKPVILTSFDGHAVWVNSHALDIAGVTSSTPDPVGGKIVRDAAGNPTGVLREMAASNLVNDKVPPLSVDQIKEMLDEDTPSGCICRDYYC